MTDRLRLCAILLPALSVATVPAIGAPVVIDQWTFEGETIGASAFDTQLLAPAVSLSGSPNDWVKGHHAVATSWTSSSGNGSARSAEGNHWSAGDYWEVDFTSVGLIGLTLSFDQRSSLTGPRDFKLQTSTDRTNFTDTGDSYSVLSTSWSTITPSGIDTYTFSLPDDTVALRLVQSTTTSVGGGTISATGTDRIDNVLITGIEVVATPEPSSLAILGAVPAILLAARRRRTAA